MTIQRFERTQVVPTTLDEAWSFFSSPANLPLITPPSLGFEVRSPLPSEMYPGLFIAYRVRPLLGVPLEWVTEITQVAPRRFFVDEQRVGPYRIWHHEHHFREVPEGVEMRDLIHYSVGFGPIGDLVASRIVHKRIEGIFDFRRTVLQERFGPIAAGRPGPEPASAMEGAPA